MELTNHAYERYCLRILNLELDKNSKVYIEENKEEIKEDVLNMFNQATYLIKAKFHDHQLANFYIFNNVVMVTNEADQAIKTIYKVDFGFSENATNFIVEDIMKSIREIKSKIELENNIGSTYKNSLEVKKEENDAQIESLKRQISLLEMDSKSLQHRIDGASNSVKMLEESLAQQAYKICYSINYKLDSFKK